MYHTTCTGLLCVCWVVGQAFNNGWRCLQVAAIKNDIAKFEQENQQLDASRQALMLKLEEKFNNERQTCDEASTKLRHVNKNMDQLLSSIDGIFKKISCDPKPILEMLGGDAGIVSKNAMIYLGQIEHRTSELLTAMAYLQKKVRYHIGYSWVK